MGQVPHALLTRPPLSFKESKLPFGFVRLACVKHAASVHPEPGSNSRKKVTTELRSAIDSNLIFGPFRSGELQVQASELTLG